ncbi:putative permease [Geobacter sp. DSM 9736]|nr:putative permease [Geobacter sp. DSM 9736]
MMNQRQSPKMVGMLVVAGLAVAVGYAVRHTVSCFLLSFVLAYLLDPLLVTLEKHGIKRSYGIALLYTALTIFSAFFVAVFVPLLTTSWYGLLNGLPGYLQKGKALALAWKAEQRYEAQLGWLFENATSFTDHLVAKFGGRIYAAAGTMAFNLLNMALAPILVFFMLYYKEEIKRSITLWLPPGQRKEFLGLGREINDSVGGYIRGQLIVSAIVAVLSAAALFFLDIDYAIFNGIFAGLASILPFIGVIIATIPALFFAYVKFQSGLVLLQVIAAFSLIYFIEGYVIKPLVFKKALDLNPLITIIFVMAFGEVMGFWGILLAIPIAAAIKIVLEHYQHQASVNGA